MTSAAMHEAGESSEVEPVAVLGDAPPDAHGVAIVGMAGRFPGAESTDELWRLLRDGVEAVARLSHEEVIASGEDPEAAADPHYVPAAGLLRDVDKFDASLFGYSPHEAAVMDPQQRAFLQAAWSAFEDAGYDPTSFPGPIGVYAGGGWNSYFLFNVAPHARLLLPESRHRTLLGNEGDNLSTRTSYKLDLKGPSITVQTGCSTSLVAVALAYQSLLAYECDMALAGGVSIRVPQAGYVHQPDSIFSGDGHCRAFDASADGTVTGSGVGVVVLRRLRDALEAGDHVRAVILGAAVNNDGSRKVGYTAPSVEGQAAVIREAYAMADIEPESVAFVEAHGTGTAVGDPIEVTALTKAFRGRTGKRGYCALGSVKTNIGHLDAAAGVAGLIKAVLALEHRQIPPTLHFERANPDIDLASSPFYVPTGLKRWDSARTPRRAGVSSFGLGGTNAHVVLEEPAAHITQPKDGRPQLLVLSARTEGALDRVSAALADHLRREADQDLADVAFTLQVGRKGFEHRRMLVATDGQDAVGALDGPDPVRAPSRRKPATNPEFAFMFSGQGSQYAGMARELFDEEPSFRGPADRCLEILRSQEGIDLAKSLWPDRDTAKGDRRVDEPLEAQLGLFVVEYALARTWMSWGIAPAAAIGHSIGEYVAATIAGVFRLEDALEIVTARGRLMQERPPGAMLAIRIPGEELEGLLAPEVSIAAVNEAETTVVSGPPEAVEALREELRARRIVTRHVRASRAFHSAMMDPVAAGLPAHFGQLRLKAPALPFVSGVSGTWITDEAAVDPAYWARHLREPVRFMDGVGCLLRETDCLLLEVGPGRTLSGFAIRHADGRGRVVPPSLPTPLSAKSDREVLLNSLGQTWLAGADIEWSRLHVPGSRRRVPLPTYSFEPERHWIEPPEPVDIRNEPSPHPSANVVWQAVVEAGGIAASSEVAALGRNGAAELDRLSAAYMHLALHRLGAAELLREPCDEEALMERCAVLSHYRQLVSEWLDALVRAGRLARTPVGALVETASCSEAEVAILLGEARAAPAVPRAAVELVQRCGESLTSVLRGELDPLTLFLPILEPTDDGLVGTEYARILGCAVEALVAQRPASPPLRVLEVGGGTGIATREVVPRLPADRAGYTFTDAGLSFVAKARRQYARQPLVHCEVLDIEDSLSAQGFSEHAYDLVVAANVLHATGEIHRSLAQVRSLLAPQGLLLMAEITRPSLDFAVTYGLLMNPVSDTERSAGDPFLSADEWREALVTAGFAEVACFPEDDSLGHRVFAAQVPAENAPSLSKRHDVGDWFSVPSWRHSPRPRVPESRRDAALGERWLVLLDEHGLGDMLVRRLETQGREVAVVTPGRRYVRHGPASFALDPGSRGDYARMLADLRAGGGTPSHVLHLWGARSRAARKPNPMLLGDGNLWSFHGLLLLAQAIGDQELGGTLELILVSTDAHELAGEDIAVENALALAASRVIPLEYPNVNCRSVDIAALPADSARRALVVDHLLEELLTAHQDQVVALRGPHRWVPTIERIQLGASSFEASRLRKAGVYLLTGGLGKIATEISEHLLAGLGAKLVLVGRSGVASEEAAARVRRLEALGAEVLVLSADAGDALEMKRAIETAERRFGSIHGVIHAAGVLGDGALQEKTLEDVNRVLRPKVAGALVLDELFRDRKLDFLVLFSSLSSLKPGFGQVAYAAANGFLDAYAYLSAVQGRRPTTCINWDVWQGGGMAYDAVAPGVLRRAKETDFERRGILPAEGAEAFMRAVASGLPQVLVSTSGYLEVLEARDGDLSKLYLEALRPDDDGVDAFVRPDLSTPYEAPATETEVLIAGVWQDLLGIASVGALDDFFELGGDSLVATQVIARIKTLLGVRLPARAVYTHSTVRSMATAAEGALLSEADPRTLAAVVDRLANRERLGA